MSEEPQTLKEVYHQAEAKRAAAEQTSTTSPSYHSTVTSAIELYELCLTISDRISLFSPNESLEDITTSNLQYLPLHYHCAELLTHLFGDQASRISTLQKSQHHYTQFLRLLDNYDIISKDHVTLFEIFQNSPNKFSTAPTNDPARRRETKIAQYKAEKEIKQKLEYLRQRPSHDDSVERELRLTEISFYTTQAFANLESIAQELAVLALAPAAPPPISPADPREQGNGERSNISNFSDRLDPPTGLNTPLLSPEGKPLRPFTLTPKRQELRNGVFRPDHSLPTMSIDEYLEEERKRGGIIEGGGEASRRRAVIDEDDVEVADRETMKAREWDEFTESNPRGAGNTINRG
ncbi:TAP42-like protein [Piedraia hortae CBS 480.64]|uniref:TAP42-like protein n=1 Tax=Piedraia hortae CBS 480.64 TaxID=1314780 RepID=A0A6A7C0X6_9PEZI|nr:TAP42-like protein [Piedraia hortae CBS 480.64]